MQLPGVINAAGKLTALGGSAQSEAVALAQMQAAQSHVSLADLRAMAGDYLAKLTGAEAGCVTPGAAAGISIATASIVTGNSIVKVQQLPQTDVPHRILLQAGHAVDFGAPVEQMIRLGGGSPTLLGSTNLVSSRHLKEQLAGQPTAMLYVQSHHCVQDNMVPFDHCVSLCKEAGVPIIVDAAAEEDLTRYISAGADLVTYSGGKAFGGPTVGFIVGQRALVDACELQFRGIARTMKVGKEAIAGLITALDEYTRRDASGTSTKLERRNQLMKADLPDIYDVDVKPDEAGRSFQRVTIGSQSSRFDVKELVQFLEDSEPSIRTRNHHLDQGYLMLDPRELTDTDASFINQRLLEFAAQYD